MARAFGVRRLDGALAFSSGLCRSGFGDLSPTEPKRGQAPAVQSLAALLRGFTLLELLVVIAIIALLATLGTAAWQRSQRYSRAVACMQNLRQIGTGLARYVGEHDGIFPELVMSRTSKTDAVPAIDTELRAYVPDARTFACPDDSKHLAQTSGTSYLWNHKLNGQRLASLSVSFLAMSPIDEPSRIMVMGDKEGFHPNIENKLNVLYADGHASQELTFLSDEPQK